jgi:opacity protein-like surface antigen
MKPILLVFILILSWPFAVHARVFNFKETGLGVMLRGTGGMTGVADDAYGNSSGDGTSMDDESKYSYGGELGAILGLGEGFNVRIGAEILKPHPVKGHGKNPSDQERFELESSVFMFNPNIAFEIFLKKSDSIRFFGQFGVGYAMVDVENRYDMTTQGTTDLGVGDFNEKMSGTAIAYMIGAGLETTMLDNVTLSLECGYRYVKISELKYTGDVNNIVAPSGAAKDATALNNDGTKRTLDLGGVFAGASLRFYLNFL